jgi:hypothetical protein
MMDWRHAIRAIFTVRWQPAQDTLVAVASAALMVLVYYTNTHFRNPWVNVVVWLILGNLLLNVVIPAYCVLRVRREGLAGLGITTRLWWLAALLSIGWSLWAWGGLQYQASRRPEVDLLPHVLGNALTFWEPFFVYGWLQLRFERAFGVIPGIVLAGLSFAAYHLGTYPLEVVGRFAVAGMANAALFRITGNLLTIWPLAHAITASIGTLRGAFAFDWPAVAARAVLVGVQLAAIAWIARRAERPTVAGVATQAPERP